MRPLRSIPDVCDVWTVCGPEADPGAPPTVLCELPHGATRRVDLAAAKALIRSYPEARYDRFFLANTDQGSPEYGARFAAMISDPEGLGGLGIDAAAAARLRPRAARMKVLMIRCLIPRTIADVNRVWEPGRDLSGANLTGVLAPFITEPAEVLAVRARYDEYQAVIRAAYEMVCGAGGWAFNLHTYAPISVSIVPGEPIVDTLERAYRPENYPSYPRRPEAQLITATPGGEYLGDRALAAAIAAEYARIGVKAVENEPFDLHPATTCAAACARYPGRVTVLELSRERLAEVFDPFTEMTISDAKVEAMAGPLAAGFLRRLDAGG